MLPRSWHMCVLGDVLEVVSGFAFKSSDYKKSGHFLIRIGNVQQNKISLDNPKYVEISPATQRFELKSNDILTSLTGNIGRAARVDKSHLPAALNQRVARLGPIEGLADDRYLFFFLSSGAFRDKLASQGQGAAQQNVSPKAIAAIPFPLPPLAEQHRIIAKLDGLFARLASARAELERVPAIAKALRLRALQTAFHWETADEELPKGWSRKTVGEIGSVQLGRQRSPKDHSGPHMRPYVRAANITWSGIDASDIKEMNFTPAEFEVFRLKRGDILLNEGSGSAAEVGKPAVWNEEVKDACFQNTLLRVRPYQYEPKLLQYCLLYAAISGRFIQDTKGVNIIHIGKAGLSQTIIPVPPVNEQRALLHQIECFIARADRLEAEATRACALLDRLEAAILAKAFRGELVSQVLADEPASVLLERIRAERSAAPAPRPKRAS